jgi:signal transduction histidine kinase
MPKRRHTLLVVDDEPDVVRSVQDLLRLDYRVLTATRGEDGMRLMQNEEVHIVMTDQRMPGMTGVEFLSNIRGDHPEAIRLLFTGYADIKAVIEAINAGNVYRYITKPWDPDELQTVIREACDRFDLITERNRLLDDLKLSNEQLTKLNQELREASELKSAFIQVASHELRTPLTILLGLSDLAARAPNLQEPLRGWLERMKAASGRLMRLVEQIVTMLAAGKFEQSVDRKPSDLAPLIRAAVDDVQPFIDLRGQTLVREFPADLGQLAVEPARIRDALNHLLLNAVKFTPDGGKITVRASRTNDGGAEIVVSDTGVGISQAEMSHLFEPFFTGFDVAKHSSGHFEYGKQGLGLGLSVVKAFVTMHGGTLDVQSEPGRGTTFTIRLPSA